MAAGIVTLLFTDLVGSTTLLDQLGDDEFDRLRRHHFRVLRDQVARAGGEEVKSLGDGLMVVFGSAVDGMRCAVDIQRAVAAVSDRIGVRVGLHVGDPIRDEDDYFGLPVVVARRLCDRADAGQILASSLVCELIGTRGRFELRPVGDLELKGLSSPVTTLEVVWQRARDATGLPASLARAGSEAFVGREHGLHALSDAWTRVRSGGTELVLVAGEPGIGKTRLAAEAAAAAQRDGAQVLYGRCDEETLVPYQPFVEVLSQLVAAIGDGPLLSLIGDAAPDLARLLPDLPRRLPTVAASTSADPEAERYLMFEAVISLLAGATATNPVLVVLDDLHWADAPTLRLLRHLVRNGERMRALIVGTYRDTDLDRSHPLAAVLADLRREQRVERVRLTGLAAGEVAALVAALADQELDERGAALATAIHSETEGNPFFVREVLRHLVETGALDRRAGRWISATSIEQLGIPEGVREVIGHRLSRLDDDANRILGAASVLGRDFELDLLAAVTGTGIDDLVDTMERALAAALLTESSDGVDRYSFSHALVRQALYEEIPTARRVRLHRRAGEALEAAADRDARFAEIARHYVEAGDSVVEKAVEYSLRASARAMATLAYEEASRLIDAALAAVDDDDDARRARLLVELARSRTAEGDVAAAARAAAAAVEAARRTGDVHLFVDAVLVFAGAPETGPRSALVRELLDEALEVVGPAHTAQRAVLLARTAAAVALPGPGSDGEPGLARRLAAEAHDLARAVGDHRTIATVARGTLAAIGFFTDTLDERRAGAEELRRLALDTQDEELELTAVGWQYISAFERGLLTEAASLLDDYEAKAAALRTPLDRYFGLMWRTELLLIRGEFDDAARLIDEAFALGQRTGFAGTLPTYGVGTFVLRRAVGGLEELEPVVRNITEQPGSVTGWRPALVYLLAELGRTEEARHELTRLDVGALADDPLGHLNLALLAEVAWLLDDGDLAAIVMPLLAEKQVPNITAGAQAALGAPGLFLGAAAAAAGRLDDAVRDLEGAVAANERMGAVPWVAEAQARLADVLDRRAAPGDADRAAALRVSALRTAEDIGMTRLADRLRSPAAAARPDAI